MTLSDSAIRHAKPAEKPYKLSDARGLHVLVTSAGKYWRWNYRVLGKQKTLSYGTYPDLSLAAARDKHQAARILLAAGTDPAEAKKHMKLEAKLSAASAFEAVSREFYETKTHQWPDYESEKWIRLLEENVFPHIGALQLSAIKPPSLVALLRRVEDQKGSEIAHFIKDCTAQVFRYGAQTGRCEHNPVRDLDGVLSPVKSFFKGSTIVDAGVVRAALASAEMKYGSAAGRVFHVLEDLERRQRGLTLDRAEMLAWLGGEVARYRELDTHREAADAETNATLKELERFFDDVEKLSVSARAMLGGGLDGLLSTWARVYNAYEWGSPGRQAIPHRDDLVQRVVYGLVSRGVPKTTAANATAEILTFYGVPVPDDIVRVIRQTRKATQAG